jgi:hypothetical protein
MEKLRALLVVVLCAIAAIVNGQNAPKAKGDGRFWKLDKDFLIHF